MSAERSVHIVSFDVPFPPDYGGVTDVYYRCRALKNAGFKVILHCFEYGRGRSHDHSAIADEVCYYDRRKNLANWFSRLPFIVKTRNAYGLLERLLQDDYPIVFEGQHTTFFLGHPLLEKRKKLVRLHNIEWQYYEGLSRRTSSTVKKIFFRTEARRLKRHESTLGHATVLACISHSDLDYYRKAFGSAVYVPVGFEQYPVRVPPANCPPFVLFHGNLSVPENHEAALWILEAFRGYTGQKELVIAGKQPQEELTEMCKGRPGIKLIAGPDGEEMQRLIRSADAHLAVTFQQSGIKIKLLNALISGKPCIATPQMVAGSGIEELCSIVSSPEELIAAIGELQPLSDTGREKRIERIRELFPEARFVNVVRALMEGQSSMKF
jgi:glycosyltransferase involved in cell wall biosynthesis